MPRHLPLAALICSVVLTGCGSIYFPSDADQAASFAEYKRKKIRGERSDHFILRRTVPLLPSEGTNEMLSTVERDGTGEWDPVSGSALATAISHDGYFLTADHVVEENPPFLAEYDPDGLIINRGRTVKRFPGLDLAIIKFEDVRKPYFPLRNTPPGEEDILLSGGPSGMVVSDIGPRQFLASGRISRVRPLESQGVPAWRLNVEIPNRPGSSGGPVIDEKGNLCGIVVAGKYGRFAKRKTPLTYATMLEGRFIEALIREDRASNR